MITTFKEFFDSQNYELVKKLVLHSLDPAGDAIDPNSNSTLSRPLIDFKSKKNILKNKKILDMIDNHPERGAILASFDNADTTVGELISLISYQKNKSPKKDFLG